MPRVWVVNASPVIALANAGCVHVLAELCDGLVLPDGVAQELAQGPDDRAKSWLKEKAGYHGRSVVSVDPRVSAWDLGLGESHVLTVCLENPGFEAVIDDRVARNCAMSLGIPFRGTLSVLVLAYGKGIVKDLRVVFDEMQRNGFRINPGLIEKAMSLVESGGK